MENDADEIEDAIKAGGARKGAGRKKGAQALQFPGSEEEHIITQPPLIPKSSLLADVYKPTSASEFMFSV